jgi:glutaredoxin
MKHPSIPPTKQSDERPASTLAPQSIPVVLYTRAGCHLCEDAKLTLDKHQDRFPLQISEVDIDRDPVLKAKYGECVPVVTIYGKERFRGRVSEALLLRLLAARRT